jgi:pilus assembly protein CpaF
LKYGQEIQEQILRELDLTKDIKDEELMDVIHRVLDERARNSYIPLTEQADLGRELFNALRKLDVLQDLIEDDEITEIMINGTEHIFIEKEGSLYQLEKGFSDRRKLEDVIQQIVADANRIVNEASPIVDARLRDGSRVNVVLYPVALNGPAVTIRKFPKEPMTMQDLVQKHSLNQEINTFLEQLIISKYNIFISGGTGSG